MKTEVFKYKLSADDPNLPLSHKAYESGSQGAAGMLISEICELLNRPTWNLFIIKQLWVNSVIFSHGFKWIINLSRKRNVFIKDLSLYDKLYKKLYFLFYFNPTLTLQGNARTKSTRLHLKCLNKSYFLFQEANYKIKGTVLSHLVWVFIGVWVETCSTTQ